VEALYETVENGRRVTVGTLSSQNERVLHGMSIVEETQMGHPVLDAVDARAI